MSERSLERRQFVKGIGSATILGAVGTASAASHATLSIVPRRREVASESGFVADVVLSEAPDGVKQADFTVQADGVNAEIVDGQYAQDFPTTGTLGVDSADDAIDFSILDRETTQVPPGSTDVPLGTVRLTGTVPGDAELSLSDVSIFGDGDSSPRGVDASGATVTVTPGPTPTISTVVDGPVYVGQETTARVVIDRVPANFDQGEFTLVVDPDVVTITDGSYSQNFSNTVEVEISEIGDDATFKFQNHDGALELGDHGAEIATVTLEATAAGTTVVDPNDATFIVDGEVADFEYRNGTGTVAELDPVDGTVPTDPDGDGEYEDLTGNGEIDLGDASVYYDNRDNPALTEHESAYDYTGNGDIDLGDVRALYEEASN